MENKTLKYLQSGFYFLSFIIIGIMAAIPGPMVPLLSKNTNVPIGNIGFLFTAGALGFVITSLLGGRLFDRFKGHRVMLVGFVLVIICMTLIPITPFFSALIIIFIINGFATNFIDLGANTLVVWAHRENVGSFLNALHFFFGVGATIGPLLVTITRASNGEATPWPFWISAIALIPLSFVAFFLPSPQPIVAETKEGASQPEKTNYLLVLLYAMILFLYVGGEIGFGNWIFTYVTETGVATIAQGDTLTSIFWGALTVGRLLSIMLVKKLNPLQMLTLNFSGWVAGMVLILIFPNSSTILWIGTIILGFFMSSIFPMIFAIAERTVVFTGKVSGLIYVGNSLGGMIPPFMMGKLFDTVNPIWIMYLEMFCALGCFAIFFFIWRLTKDKFK